MDREQICNLASDLGRVWEPETTSIEVCKTLISFLVKRVHLDGKTEAGQLRIDVEWHTGAHAALTIDRPLLDPLPCDICAPPVRVLVQPRLRDARHGTLQQVIRRSPC